MLNNLIKPTVIPITSVLIATRTVWAVKVLRKKTVSVVNPLYSIYSKINVFAQIVLKLTMNRQIIVKTKNPHSQNQPKSKSKNKLIILIKLLSECHSHLRWLKDLWILVLPFYHKCSLFKRFSICFWSTLIYLNFWMNISKIYQVK